MKNLSLLGSNEPAVQEWELYLDIDEAAVLLGVSRSELWDLAECGIVPAHELRHEGRYCWKFKASELIDVKCKGFNRPGASIQ